MMDASADRALETGLARVLKIGTIVASSVIGIGLALQWLVAARSGGGPSGGYGLSIITIGLAIFLALPCLRVLLMLIAFVLGRDYAFGAVAAMVLLIIVVALAIGAFAPAKASQPPSSGGLIGASQGDRYPLLTCPNAALILCTDRYKEENGWIRVDGRRSVALNTAAVDRWSHSLFGGTAPASSRRPFQATPSSLQHDTSVHNQRVRAKRTCEGSEI